MTIRQATADDIPAISRLYTEFFAHNAGHQPTHYTAATETGGYPAGVINSTRGDILLAPCVLHATALWV